MNDNFERRSLQLTHEEWRRLEYLAEAHDTKAPAGPTTGEPSWRTLIKAIAKGDLMVSRSEEAEVSHV
jgi:hypothetical protein